MPSHIPTPAQLSVRALVLWVLVSTMSVAWVSVVQSQSISTRASHAFLYDMTTGSVLYNKNGDEPFPPASMVKMMTAAVTFDEIRTGRLSLEDTFTVSADAWRRGGAPSGGSAMYLVPDEVVRIEDLIKGITVQSGNDAAIALAQGISGTEESFAALMNSYAAELGLTQSVFKNASGLPAEGQLSTARELARIAEHLISDFPEFYRYFQVPELPWRNRVWTNRNPLLGVFEGADGVKTGQLRETGYAMVGSAVQDGRRLIVVVSGLSTARDRLSDATKLLQWGFRSFDATELFGAEDRVGSVRVYGGDIMRVPVRGKDPVVLMTLRGTAPNLRARVIYEGPVRAPIDAGEEIAQLVLLDGDKKIMDVPLVAAQDVNTGPIHRRAFDAAIALIRQWITGFGSETG